MMLFWLICALLIIIAFAFVLPTVLQRNDKSQRTVADERKLANIAIYRDQLSELEADLKNGIVSQEQYAQDRDEIERRLLEDTAGAAPAKRKAATVPPANRSTAYAITFSLPLIAVIFYFQIGSPQSLYDSEVQTLINLARSYSSKSQFGEAAGAYAKATELRSNNADLWVEYAFASAMANQQRLEGQPTELINRALKLDPENIRALELAGSAAFQAKDYKTAIAYWERALKKIPPEGSEVTQAIQSRINEAKNLAGNK